MINQQRGTRIIQGDNAIKYSQAIEQFRAFCISNGFSEIIMPSIWSQETFIKQAGQEITNQMWTFQDKGSRNVCLIPEVTACISEIFNGGKLQNKRVFYIQRCYRYERPQEGRYREFTQMGVEAFNAERDELLGYMDELLRSALKPYQCEKVFKSNVKRGLHYYTGNGFEVECPILGAQKQIAGGGCYGNQGIGWAIGLDRLLLAEEKTTK